MRTLVQEDLLAEQWPGAVVPTRAATEAPSPPGLESAALISQAFGLPIIE